MRIQAAIDVRTSRRKYNEQAIATDALKALEEKMDEYNRIGGFRIELITHNGEAFKGFSRSYGMIQGAQHYFGFIADTRDGFADEKIGYYGELLVLLATTFNLGTCWIGGTFSKSKTPFKLASHERLACLVTVGYTDVTLSKKEQFIHKLTHRKTKSTAQMSVCDITPPDWFLSGMEGVKKAPSAMNKQPIVFHYKSGEVTAHIDAKIKYLAHFDLGIAKCHFELASGGGSWAWGDGVFTRHSSLTL